MKTTIALEFLKRGYYIADDTMRVMHAAIGYETFNGLDNQILVMRDKTGAEIFNFPWESIMDDNREWQVAKRIVSESTSYTPEAFKYIDVNDENIISLLLETMDDIDSEKEEPKSKSEVVKEAVEKYVNGDKEVTFSDLVNVFSDLIKEDR